MPKDKFKKHLFCFDTEVYEVNEKNKELFGFGGTSFIAIEEHIQFMLKNKKVKKYPSAVFVITDGYGNSVKPAKPNKWYWFLTSNGSKHFIPKESKIFSLNNYS